MKSLICFSTLVLALLFSNLADLQAANLNINDLIEGQITLSHDGNWEGGVNSNGNAYPASTAGVEVVPGEVATFTGTWIAPGIGSPGLQGVIYFVDPGSPNIVSDIVKATWDLSSFATIAIDVESSPEGADLGPLPATFAGLGIVETGATQAIQGLFRDPTSALPVSIPSNLTIQFGSIPEPSTLLLGAVAGVCLVFRRKRA